MKYRMIFEKDAVKFLDSQTKKTRERLLTAIYKLPHEGDVRPLSGHKGLYRLRVGGFRIIFRIDEENRIVVVTAAGNRGQIYKGS